MASMTDEEAEVTCAGDLVWAPIDLYLSQQGGAAMMKFFKSIDGSYNTWLVGALKSTQAEIDKPSWKSFPDGEGKGSGSLPLYACPRDYSRNIALRTVEYEG